MVWNILFNEFIIEVQYNDNYCRGNHKGYPYIQEEVAKILNLVNNIKYKAIRMLIYSAGLRVDEVV